MSSCVCRRDGARPIAHRPAGDGEIGVALKITKLAGGSVSYEVTGARDRLLLLRALNAKGQPLDRWMAMSADFMFGEGSQDKASITARSTRSTSSSPPRRSGWPIRSA